MRFRERMEKITDNIIPDLRDNFPALSNLKQWELSDSEADPSAVSRVKERFISREQHQQFLSALADIKPGQFYEYTWLVGRKPDGTSHPHVFLAENTGDKFNLFFIDPEHNVGKQNMFRPKISNLIAMRIAADYESSEINIMRFNTEGLTPDQLKLRQQFAAAKELLDEKHQPAMLENLQNNILFQASIGAHSAILRAKYGNSGKTSEFFGGGAGPRALRGKVRANYAIISRFISYLEEGKLEASKRFTKAPI